MKNAETNVKALYEPAYKRESVVVSIMHITINWYWGFIGLLGFLGVLLDQRLFYIFFVFFLFFILPRK